MARVRSAIRCGVLLLGAAFAAWDAPETLLNFRHWREAVRGDPAAAEFWGAALRMDAGEIAIVLGAALAVWLMLRPRKRAVDRP